MPLKGFYVRTVGIKSSLNNLLKVTLSWEVQVLLFNDFYLLEDRKAKEYIGRPYCNFLPGKMPASNINTSLFLSTSIIG